MAGHVFISHASENQDEANELVALIESKGVTAWIAPRDVRPGLDYSEELQKAIEGCVAFVVIVTSDANTSPYVRAETEMAFSCHKPMLPVRFADIATAPGLAFFLKIRNWTNAYGAKREAALARLVLELQTLTGNAPSWAPRVGSPSADPAPPAPPPPPQPVSPSAIPAAPPPLADLPPPAKMGKPTLLLAIVGGVALIAIAVAIVFLARRAPQTPPQPGPDVNGSRPAPAPPAPGPAPARAYGGELVDFGVPAKSELESNVGSPTPLNVPVGQRTTTVEVQQALTDGTNPILVDVLAGAHAQTLPNALYMPAGGMPGSFQDQWQAVFAQQLSQATGGDTNRPLVFFCQGASCWESYNAVLRANAAGYANIFWYRGGLGAWAEAAYPTSPLPAPYGGMGADPNGE